MVASLCLAVTAALVLARLQTRSRRGRWAIAVIAGLGVMWDGWIRELPLPAPPARSAVLEERGGPEPVLDLPAGGDADAAALYRAMFHQRPLVNGFSGHEPPHYAALRLGLASRDVGVLAAVAERGPFQVRVDRSQDSDGSWERWIAGQPGVRPVGEGPQESVFLLAGRSASRVALGERVPVRTLRSNVGADSLSKSVDGDTRTFWSSRGTQSGRERIVLDLGEERPVGTVVLCLGALVRDFPRTLRIEVSSDERHWLPAWEGGAAGPAVSAGLADPGDVPVRFSLGNVSARYVRLRQLGTDAVFGWSIAEIQLFAPTNAASGL